MTPVEPRPPDGTQVQGSLRQVREAFRAALPPQDGLACAKGCSHCCRTYVSATPADLLLLTAYIRRTREGDELERLKTRLRFAAKSERTREGPPPVCPFLEDSLCSVYEERPSVCAHHVSTDVKACETLRARVDAADNTPLESSAISAGADAEENEKLGIWMTGGLHFGHPPVYGLWGAVSTLLREPKTHHTLQELLRLLEPHRITAPAPPGHR